MAWIHLPQGIVEVRSFPTRDAGKPIRITSRCSGSLGQVSRERPRYDSPMTPAINLLKREKIVHTVHSADLARLTGGHYAAIGRSR